MTLTVTIDDELFRDVQRMASEQAVPVHALVAGLVQRAIEGAKQIHRKGGFPVFSVPAGAEQITPQDVQRGEDEP
jgi:hypothetical protein